MLGSVKTERNHARRQQDPTVGHLEIKSASPKDWQSMADLSLVEDEALNKGIEVMLSEKMDLWSVRLGTIRATHFTINLKKEHALSTHSPSALGNDLKRCFVRT